MKRWKKSVITLLVLSLVMVNGIIVSAKEGTSSDANLEYGCENLDSIEGIDLESHKEESERLIQLGEAASRRRATRILSGFKNLQQGDSAWKNVVMQSCGKTIGSAGCCLTSFTMIQRYYGGADNPTQVNTKLGNAACPFAYGTAASKYGYTYNLVTSGTNLGNHVNYIKGAISSGNPVLIGMEYSGGTHFVAAYGYTDNEIVISDPAGRNYQYLSQYTNNGYSVYRLCTYFK